MPNDDTTRQNRTSGEHKVSGDELLRELREARRENVAGFKELATKLDDQGRRLGQGEVRFENHEGRLKTLEGRLDDHEEDHAEEAKERRVAPWWVQLLVGAAISAVVTAIVLWMLSGVLAGKVAP